MTLFIKEDNCNDIIKNASLQKKPDSLQATEYK